MSMKSGIEFSDAFEKPQLPEGKLGQMWNTIAAQDERVLSPADRLVRVDFVAEADAGFKRDLASATDQASKDKILQKMKASLELLDSGTKYGGVPLTPDQKSADDAKRSQGLAEIAEELKQKEEIAKKTIEAWNLLVAENKDRLAEADAVRRTEEATVEKERVKKEYNF